jgi:periplasmic protein TonB
MGREAALRLVLALLLSAALHVSFIYGIGVGPVGLTAAPTIVARLAPRSAATAVLPESRRAPRAAAFPVASGGGVRATTVTDLLPLAEPVPASYAAPDESTLPRADVPLIVDPAWYAARELDLFPRPVTPVDPAYPESAADVSGEVSLLVKIDEFGAVREVTVVSAEPAGYFEDAAAQAFKASRFSPAQRDGHPVRSQIVVKVRFAPQLQARE